MGPDEFLDNLILALISTAYIVGLFLIFVGIIILVYESNVYYNIQKINNWPVFKESGIVTLSIIETAGNGYHLTLPLFSDISTYEIYRTRIAFEYTVNGVKYQSTKLSYYEPWSSDIIHVNIEDEYYQPGTIVDVIVNPNNPSEAYLVNKKYGGYVYLIGSIVFIVVGGLLYERATR
jgi:hypothetical protein